MTTSSIVQSNLLLFSKQGHRFHGKLWCLKSENFGAVSKLGGAAKSTSISTRSRSRSRIETAISTMGKFINSSSKEKYSFEKTVITQNVLKILRIPGMVLLLSLLLVMACGTNSALARSGGVMGGHSFRSSSSKSRSSRSKSLSKADGDDVDEHETARLCFFVFTLFFAPVHVYLSLSLLHTSIIKLQVGLLVKGGSLQNDLNQIAKTTDTSKKCGWRNILRGTINCLSTHSSRWISGYSHMDVLLDCDDDPEGRFKQLSDEERKKFDEETLVNLNNTEKGTMTSQEVDDQPRKTYMVVTVLVAAKGWYKVPTITGKGAIEKILLELKYICKLDDRIQGLLVLWTPQRKDEVLLLEDLQRDYPLLKPFNA